ncbi:uncharacterized protein SAPINGB_P003799 [Magnusiomyces paraingens]|uniref:Guanine deaminase n=1 Tax=Magnusiomyces paraingens TaxID=2606893 RepID=A0A5E8BYM9_9ASCO|nr:uncharacterized protein SAPINGB_P003799 [Saprochaete ingens]VVT53885.1 unnamed protein product [Saprochaete ingens]
MTVDTKPTFTIYYGTFVNPVSISDLEYVVTGAIGVNDKSGTIEFVERNVSSVDQVLADKASLLVQYTVNVISNTDKQASFFFPGFFDTHIHAPQYPNCGIFGKSTLLDWLETYTFPLESSLSNIDKAKFVYNKVIDRTLRSGTTTASYYATVHVGATKALADVALERGQRAFVGRVCMTQNSPDYYCDASEEAAQAADLEVIDYVTGLDPTRERVAPILTPRFAPSCTPATMKWMGQVMHERDLACQTHLSENVKEIAWVKELFPENDSYTDVYDKAGILGKRTILAHCVHLSDTEVATIKARGSGISHCPTSNSSITSGEAPMRRYLDAGVKCSLGTDLSGGYAPSVLEVARQALLVSRHVAMKSSRGDADKLSVAEVLCLGTIGGAQVCEMADQLGSFEVGKKWDAQLIDLEVENSPVDVFEWQEPRIGEGGEDLNRLENLVAKWLFGGDDRNVSRVWVDGRQVIGSK